MSLSDNPSGTPAAGSDALHVEAADRPTTSDVAFGVDIGGSGSRGRWSTSPPASS